MAFSCLYFHSKSGNIQDRWVEKRGADVQQGAKGWNQTQISAKDSHAVNFKWQSAVQSALTSPMSPTTTLFTLSWLAHTPSYFRKRQLHDWYTQVAAFGPLQWSKSHSYSLAKSCSCMYAGRKLEGKVRRPTWASTSTRALTTRPKQKSYKRLSHHRRTYECTSSAVSPSAEQHLFHIVRNDKM